MQRESSKESGDGDSDEQQHYGGDENRNTFVKVLVVGDANVGKIVLM